MYETPACLVHPMSRSTPHAVVCRQEVLTIGGPRRYASTVQNPVVLIIDRDSQSDNARQEDKRPKSSRADGFHTSITLIKMWIITREHRDLIERVEVIAEGC